MKKVMLVMLFCACVLIVGCNNADYSHKIFDKDTGKLTGDLHISHSMCNVDENTSLLAMRFTDGTILLLINNTVTSDPNAMKAEAEFVAAILTGGGSEVLKNVTGK